MADGLARGYQCRVGMALLFACAALGQTPRQPGFVRGIMTENSLAGFAIRASDGALYRYRTDGKTWIEREHERVRAASLQPGEILEVVSDRDPDPIRYARMIHLIEPSRPRPLPVSTGGVYRLKPDAPLITAIYEGLIVAREGDRITLRTRLDGEKQFYLQPDTQYLNDGDLVGSAAVGPLMRVSIVATRQRGEVMAADRVIWGAILQPKP